MFRLPLTIPTLGIPLFFILFFFTFMIWLIDFKSIKKYYNKALLYFIFLGLFYVIISFCAGFSLIFDIPIDKSFIIRQAYFLPFIGIAIPVFARSFNFGLFKYCLKMRLLFIIIAYFILNQPALLYIAIILFSIQNHLIGFFIFLTIFIFDGGFSSSLQALLMQVILFIFFISRIKINVKYLTLSILTLIISINYLSDDIINLIKLLGLYDSNASWRLMLWIDNIKSTINDTLFFGHGFGTSYFSAEGRQPGDFILSLAGGGAQTIREHGSRYIAEFVLGQHNSFINIFYRLGIMGLLFFLAFFATIAKQINIFSAPYQLNYVLIFSMLIIGVNVGLESPDYSVLFVFLIGLVQYINFEYYKIKIHNYRFRY